MKTSLILLFNLFLMSGFCQNVPIDFESNGNGLSWNWTTFENDNNPPLEIVPNPDMSGLNTSSTVAKFTALQAGNPWAGFESMHGSDIGSFSLDITNCTVKIMVWKSVISDVGIKFVDVTSAAQPEIKVANTLIDQWEELTFDFSSRIGVYPLVKDQIVIFPDFDLAGRSEDNIIYIDNIYDLDNVSNSIIDNDLFSINVYPNPTNETLNIESDGYYSVDVLDLMGRIKFKFQIEAGSSQFNFNELSKGAYILRFNKNNIHAKVIKLFKQ